MDLAIFIKALRIQHTYSQFKNIFIHTGAFHLQMAYFHAIGKFLDNCGLIALMVNSEIIANSSVNGLVGKKHFNRCKRLFTICAVVFRSSMNDRYVQEYEVGCMTHFKKFLIDFITLTEQTIKPIP